MESLGKTVAHSGSLGDYIELSQREEDLSQYVLWRRRATNCWSPLGRV